MAQMCKLRYREETITGYSKAELMLLITDYKSDKLSSFAVLT